MLMFYVKLILKKGIYSAVEKCTFSKLDAPFFNDVIFELLFVYFYCVLKI